MGRTPFRPEHEVSQPFNSGLVTVYSVADGARPGYTPVPVLTEKARLRYEEMRLGLTRYYEAKQDSVEVNRVIRVPKPGVLITAQDGARTEDGQLYRVELVQTVPGVWPPSLDLTLKRFEHAGEEDEEAAL